MNEYMRQKDKEGMEEWHDSNKHTIKKVWEDVKSLELDGDNENKDGEDSKKNEYYY